MQPKKQNQKVNDGNPIDDLMLKLKKKCRKFRCKHHVNENAIVIAVVNSMWRRKQMHVKQKLKWSDRNIAMGEIFFFFNKIEMCSKGNETEREQAAKNASQHGRGCGYCFINIRNNCMHANIVSKKTPIRSYRIQQQWFRTVPLKTKCVQRR